MTDNKYPKLSIKEIIAINSIAGIKAYEWIELSNGDDLQEIGETTFPKKTNPGKAVKTIYQLIKASNGITESTSEQKGIIDIINCDGDIIADISINQKGVDWIKINLKNLDLNPATKH